MQFETAQQAAKRLGVTDRAIQKWAKQGRIKGAYFDRRVWQIPKDFTEPMKASEAIREIKRYHLPLLRSSYEIGKAKEFIDSIPDEDDRNIALCEWYYYTGNAEKAAQIAERYIDSEDESLRYSANVMCTFANIFRGHIHLATFFSDLVLKDLEKVRTIIAPVIEDYKSGKITYAEAEFNARTRIYQSVNPNFNPDEEYMKDPIYRDIP